MVFAYKKQRYQDEQVFIQTLLDDITKIDKQHNDIDDWPFSITFRTHVDVPIVGHPPSTSPGDAVEPRNVNPDADL